MDVPPLQLISEASQYLKPFAIAVWSVLVLTCLAGCFYAYFKGGNAPRLPIPGEFRWGWPLIGKTRNKYPVMLAFALGGLFSLILAAFVTLILEKSQMAEQVSIILGNEITQSLTLLVSSSFYSISTAWLLTQGQNAESLLGAPRGRNAVALFAGVLMGIQFAYLLVTLYFFQ